jgi:hypothetical protein
VEVNMHFAGFRATVADSRDDVTFINIDRIVAIYPARDPGVYCVRLDDDPNPPVLIKSSIQELYTLLLGVEGAE